MAKALWEGLRLIPGIELDRAPEANILSAWACHQSPLHQTSCTPDSMRPMRYS
jgi:hypothetical protein